MAVSYTHLDVYKRQVEDTPRISEPLSFFEKTLFSSAPTGVSHRSFTVEHVYSCLLYTSILDLFFPQPETASKLRSRQPLKQALQISLFFFLGIIINACFYRLLFLYHFRNPVLLFTFLKVGPGLCKVCLLYTSRCV